MSTIDTAPSDLPWPPADLEAVNTCPYCESSARTLAYCDVQDWTFKSAPGRWTYWDCAECRAIYLDPRPTEASVGRAYQKYYTHHHMGSGEVLGDLKQRLVNECWSTWLGIDIRPRLQLPRIMAPLLRALRAKIPAPFELETLASLPRSQLLDIGCGSGTTLKLGTLLGWRTTGLELDLAAVLAARREGLDILHGSYKLLGDFPESFDCVICSHVIEHVHDPQCLLRLMAGTLKVGGVAIISCPNADSHVRHRFGASWRGLEAPRHLAIPSLDFLTRMLKDLGFSVTTIEPIGSTTTKQSWKIHAERNRAAAADAKVPLPAPPASSYVTAHPDLIQLVCRKLPQP